MYLNNKPMKDVKDIYFKDEGDMITVCFQTPKAITALRKQSIEVIENTYGSVDYKKLDIVLNQKSLLVAWAMSENLNWKTDSEIIIN
jgi:hypothetical protein